MTRIGWTLPLLIFTLLAAATDGYAEIWHGWSSDHGGVVEYSISPDSLDYSESMKVTISCYALDKSIRLVIVDHAPDELKAGDSMYFYVDEGSHHEAYVELAHWGYLGIMPSAWVFPDLPKEMMRGRKLEIRFNSHYNPVYKEIDLTGTNRLFRRHLSACLN